MKKSIPPIYSPTQKGALDLLRPILNLATSPIRPDLSLKTRTHTLVTGPSGSGKSFLAKALAEEDSLPFWEINASSWIVLGARNGNPTFVSLAEWCYRHPRGVIFLDELEKPFPNTNGTAGDSSWYNAVKMEIHDLLDGRLPEGAAHVDESILMENFGGQVHPSDIKALVKSDVERKLKTSFLIVGAGTWQHLWTESKSCIGFNSNSIAKISLDHGELIKSISPEILLRFRNQVIFLAPLTRTDFTIVLENQLHLIPRNYQNRFIQLVNEAIPRALEHGLGMRIFEEIYTDLCCEIFRNCTNDPEVCRDVLVGNWIGR